MLFLYVFCSLFDFVDGLQNHLLPCPIKALTGIDCPGCGFQRSLICLLKGDFYQSWHFYPPTVPLILLFSCYGLVPKFNFDKPERVRKIMVLVVGNFVLLSYTIKMLAQYQLIHF